MPPAVIGGVIAGVGAIGASVIGSKANSKAIGQASDAQAQAAREATQLQRDIYNKNVGFQTPFLNTGNAAMGQINALLGLNVPQPAQTGGTNALPSAPIPVGDQGGGLLQGGLIYRHIAEKIARGEPVSADALAFYNRRNGGQQQPTQTATPPVTTPPISQPTAESAYNQFKNYTGYTSRLNEANDSFNSRAAGTGTLQSGAALIARDRMNQDYASNEFGNYMGYISGQQQLGPGAANALAGVGTNYANAAGNLAINQGNNAANAAIASANNRNQLYSGIASGIGGIAGSIFGGSSFSDERLKKDVITIRVRSDGLPVKSWVYRNDPDPRRYEGFVAQDVAKIYPKAVIENFNGTGFLGVNYAEIPAEEGVAA